MLRVSCHSNDLRIDLYVPGALAEVMTDRILWLFKVVAREPLVNDRQLSAHLLDLDR